MSKECATCKIMRLIFVILLDVCMVWYVALHFAYGIIVPNYIWVGTVVCIIVSFVILQPATASFLQAKLDKVLNGAK